MSRVWPHNKIYSTIKNSMKKVILQEWLESERGWGTRPDGCSIHLSEEDRKVFISQQVEGLPDDFVPDEYSRPDGDPSEAWVDNDIYDNMIESEEGVGAWMLQRAYIKNMNEGNVRLVPEKN